MASLCYTNQRYQEYLSHMSEQTQLIRNIMINILPMNIIISLFGIVTNMLNLCVFCRQALKDTFTVCFIALVVVDLSANLNILFYTLLVWFEEKMWFVLLPGLQYAQTWMLVLTRSIGLWIAVFISIQRSLAIVFTFKVNDIITKKVTTAVLMIIVMISIASIAPVLCALRFQLLWDTERNASLPCIGFTEDSGFLESISAALSAALQISALVILIISTIVLIVSLIKKTKQRLALGQAGVEKRSNSTTKEDRIIKIIVIVSVIILACYIPSIIAVIIVKHAPDLIIGLVNLDNANMLVWQIQTFLMNMNASVNIFVFYNMMATYKLALQRLLHKAEWRTSQT